MENGTGVVASRESSRKSTAERPYKGIRMRKKKAIEVGARVDALEAAHHHHHHHNHRGHNYNHGYDEELKPSTG
ncbi:hypothetical protein Gotri_007482, partial [Gossypium trilobum]|nr:hypothetical protein [Gossypium trilobum]